jgi:DNA-binding transcriptional regulator YiaG
MTKDDFRASRRALGLTQEALARLIGRTRRNIQQWESGERPVDGAAARLVRAYLDGYRPDDWYTYTRSY